MREQRRLTQEQLGERAGYTSKYISEVERGLRDLPLSTLERIVEHGLHSRVEYLFGHPLEAPVTEAPSVAVLKAAETIDALPRDYRRLVLSVLREAAELAKR